MRRKWWIAGGLVIVIALIVAGNFYRQSRASAAMKVLAEPVSTGDLAVAIDANGVVEPVEKVEIRAPASGSFQRVEVEEGDSVEKDQVLAVYDPHDLALRLRRAESELAAARAQAAQLDAKLSLDRQLRAEELARVEEQFRMGRAKQEDVDLARQALQNAGRGQALDAQLAAARQAAVTAEAAYQQALEETRGGEVRSPIAGVVLSRDGSRMGPVSKGAILFVVGDLSRVIVKAKVDEVDIGSVSLGQAVEVSNAAFPDQQFSGKIARIAPQARRETGASGQGMVNVFDVQVEIDNKDGRLRPGMTADVRIVAERRAGALTVPNDAVVEQEGKQGVFVIDQGQARFKPVRTGLTSKNRLEIREGLQAGEQVAVGPPETLKKLKDGQKVTAEPPKAAAGSR